MNWNFPVRSILVGCAVLLLVAGSTAIKFSRSCSQPFYSFGSDTALFSSEAAFQYRVIRWIAANEQIPRIDRDSQWPEGIDTWRELAVGGEYLIGSSYRLWSVLRPQTPLHVFVIAFTCFFSSLAVVCVFGLAFAMTRSSFAALAGAAVYAFAGASFDRLGTVQHEYIAVPFLFASLWCLLSDRRPLRDAWLSAVAAGIFLLAGLLCWHMTSLYLLCVVTALLFSVLLLRNDSAVNLVIRVGCMYVPVLIGAMSFPLLLNTALYRSWAVLLAMPLFLWAILRKAMVGQKMRTILVVLGVMAVVGIAAAGWGRENYGHAWAVLAAKLQFPFGKPADPAMLSFDARALWYPEFDTMPVHYLFSGLFLAFPLGLAGLVLLSARAFRRGDAPGIFLACFGLGMIILGALLFRLRVFSIFLLAVLAAVAWTWLQRIPMQRRSLRVGHAVSLGALLLLHAVNGVLYERAPWHMPLPARTDEQYGPFYYPRDHVELVEWIRSNTASNAVFMGDFEFLPLVLVYAGRRTNMQPKFEVPSMRRKFEVYSSLLFGEDAGAWQQFLDRNETDYVLLAAPTVLSDGVDSLRYIANRLDLPRSSVAYRWHFRPWSVPGWQLVFRNRYYQVFKRAPLQPAPPPLEARRKYPVYDEELINGKRHGPVMTQSTGHEVLARYRHAVLQVLDLEASVASGIPGAAQVTALRSALAAGPIDGETALDAARLFERASQDGDALRLAVFATQSLPDSAEAAYQAGRLSMAQGDVADALRYATHAVSLDPVRPEAYILLASIQLRRGQREAARATLFNAMALFPGNPHLEALRAQIDAR